MEDSDPAQALPSLPELSASQSDLIDRLRNLKQDIYNYRSNLETQVKTYQNEIVELKKTLNTELEQLRSDFKELNITLQKHQEDVTTTLKNLGMHESSELPEESDDQDVKNSESGTAKEV